MYIFNPQMTSNSQPSPLAVTASSVFGSTFDSWRAFSFHQETSGNSYWLTSSGSTGWIQIDLGSSSALPALEYYGYQGTTSLASVNAKSWTFLGSNDGSNWITLDTQTNASDIGGSAKFFPISPVAGYRYYRFNITANQGSGSFVALAQVYLCPKISVSGGAVPLIGEGPVF